jgi:hypothetical protein
LQHISVDDEEDIGRVLRRSTQQKATVVADRHQQADRRGRQGPDDQHAPRRGGEDEDGGAEAPRPGQRLRWWRPRRRAPPPRHRLVHRAAAGAGAGDAADGSRPGACAGLSILFII